MSLGFSSAQSLSRVQVFATPCTAARQASLSLTIFWGLLEFMSVIYRIDNNKILLYSTGNHIQYPEINANRKEYLKNNMYIC